MQSNRNGFWAQDPAVKVGQWRLQSRLVVDMLLNCDSGTLKFKQVPIEPQYVYDATGKKKALDFNSEVIVLTGLDEPDANVPELGDEIRWIPHVNVYTVGTTVRFTKIRCDKFGQV